jgi:hypothetical protein
MLTEFVVANRADVNILKVFHGVFLASGTVAILALQILSDLNIAHHVINKQGLLFLHQTTVNWVELSLFFAGADWA